MRPAILHNSRNDPGEVRATQRFHAEGWVGFAVEKDFFPFSAALMEANLLSSFLSSFFRVVGFSVFSDFSRFLPACGAFSGFPHHSLRPAPFSVFSVPAAHFLDFSFKALCAVLHAPDRRIRSGDCAVPTESELSGFSGAGGGEPTTQPDGHRHEGTLPTEPKFFLW